MGLMVDDYLVEVLPRLAKQTEHILPEMADITHNFPLLVIPGILAAAELYF
jgi:hypothetical protein